MEFKDTLVLDGVRRTSDGYLTASVRVARTGVQYYVGHEIDPKNEHGLRDVAAVGVYRPESEVFDRASLATLAHRPVTVNHPPVAVDASNWKDYAVGQVGDEIARDGDFIRVPLAIMDANAISQIESGKRELSAGYVCELDFTDGVSETGESYRAVQKSIKFNHLSVVDRARAGQEARIGDANWGARPIPVTDTENKSMTLKTVLVDGLSVETTEAGAQAIAKLTKDKADLAASLADAQEAFDKALAAKDGELAAKDAKIAEIEAKVLSDADLDKAAAARGDLIAKAKALAPNVTTDGKSALDIKKAVLADRKVDMADQSDAYVEAYFNILAKDAKAADSTARALSDTTEVKDAAAKAAAALAAANDMNAWRAA